MRLASLKSDGPDGELCVVSRDMTRAVRVGAPFSNLQLALERWMEAEPRLCELQEQLDGRLLLNSFPLELEQLLAPLPRAWQWLDGSAFLSHGQLMEKALSLEPLNHQKPLMYQGLADRFYAWCDDVPFMRAEDGIDFEGEFAVIVDKVPMGATAAQAAERIRLIIQLNDWSLRALAGPEMKTGFGWVQAKPPCSVAPIAVSPSELGESWKDYRVHLPLVVHWNEALFGSANGGEMGYSFAELIAHAATTRTLVAGTIIGSGTVSNANYREKGSSCIAERRGIELIEDGAATTNFMAFGDRVRMEARDSHGKPLFGMIDQKVVKA